MGAYIELTDDNFEEKVLKSEKPVLVDFWADWCVPCRMVAPIVEEIAKEYSEQIVVGKMDVDANNKTAADLQISSIPTLIVFKNGEPSQKIIGAVPKKKIKEAVENAL